LDLEPDASSISIVQLETGAQIFGKPFLNKRLELGLIRGWFLVTSQFQLGLPNIELEPDFDT
jgi:hypothetical protein